MERAKLYRGILCGLMTLFGLASVAVGVFQFARGNTGRGILAFAGLLFFAAHYLFHRIGIRPGYGLYGMLYVFLTLAYCLGSALQLFDSIPFFDKISHFLSGYVFTILGFCLFYLFHGDLRDARDDWLLNAIFAVGFSCLVAVGWEVGEFLGFVLAGMDSQQHLTTGVFDTMQDLIACLVASILCAASFGIYGVTGKKLFTARVAEEFFRSNSEGRGPIWTWKR
ncbi:MAG: hypothetical protein ACK5LX_15220 [Oscillospiraceae bacterium]